MRLLFLGDVMGRAGRDAVAERLPDMIERYRFDFVIVNGENASHGRGITEAHYELLRDAGADVVTLGDHAFDQRELMTAIERHDTLIRPINFPPGAPGRGATMITGRNGHQVLVVNALGRVFMPPMDDPFRAVDNAIARCPLGEQADAIVVDFHAEATSEMQGMGHYLDGRVSLVVGTHTHIPTSDHRILRGGTGLMSDAGMCGDYDSVIGMELEEPLNRFVTGLATARFTPSEGEATLCGVAIETDRASGLCTQIQPVRVGGSLSQALPQF
ncbi:TIGR00282 family metallophosphoesterase [Pelagibacterium flavum]|uniref:TIGR00282 family metallophosphoesterase n=1 Tax=Pelagibacterium flavum TaxID=2984530 RepID=A0ABY6ITJ3_9HYPH|nr:TIGR00282 family metallophosphoesterase [Pelagibacterium sp. YIM 151497]MAN77107.1 TIGR00282 family metallophosphoesterase [Hyphomicrobiales bacterium]UYQ73025.1 TIGR00282 family metallophosphoesterase [Pelagibacterium sp. YIM 151497]